MEGVPETLDVCDAVGDGVRVGLRVVVRVRVGVRDRVAEREGLVLAVCVPLVVGRPVWLELLLVGTGTCREAALVTDAEGEADPLGEGSFSVPATPMSNTASTAIAVITDEVTRILAVARQIHQLDTAVRRGYE